MDLMTTGGGGEDPQAPGTPHGGTFTAKAHVFHIDPLTKRSWIPASTQAANVNILFDGSRGVYRVISLEGNKAIINSTITPNMTFTKTSQKFGQWSDIRANTVYGLGFASEAELNRFIDKFQEVKEATRAAQQSSKSQSQNGMTTSSASATPIPTARGSVSSMGPGHDQDALTHNSHLPIDPMSSSAHHHHHHHLINDNNDVGTLKSSTLVAHQRSQSLSGLQAAKLLGESPKHGSKDKITTTSTVALPQSTQEAQLRYENDRLKLALAQSSANAKKWEFELQTLKSNNARLTQALQESTANVEEWKRQLQQLKEENNKMRLKALEAEAASGNPEAMVELRKEISIYRSKIDLLEIDTNKKDKEIELLKKKLEESTFIASGSKVEDKLKLLLNENENLRAQIQRYQEQSDTSKVIDKTKKGILEQLNLRLGQNVHELRQIQQELHALLSAS